MAIKPPNLKKDTWNKLKEVTVPATGFGERLAALEKSRAIVSKDQATGSLTHFIGLLSGAIAHIPKAKKKCNSVLHKKTIALLDEYEAMLKDELQQAEKILATYVANGRKVLKQYLANREEAMEVAHKVRNALSTMSSEIAAVYDAKNKGKLTKALADALDKKWETLSKNSVKLVNEAIKKWNAKPYAAYAKEWEGVVHAADVPEKEQNVITGDLQRAVAAIPDIDKAIKAKRKAAQI